MPRTGRRRQVDRSRWRQFRSVGEHFAKAAEVATEFEYWNAAGVLLVHAAIWIGIVPGQIGSWPYDLFSPVVSPVTRDPAVPSVSR